MDASSQKDHVRNHEERGKKEVRTAESPKDPVEIRRKGIETKYAEFKERVKRTVFLDNLSPLVTTSVVKTALGQFGEVVRVEFPPNYTIPFDIPRCALVEMESSKQAENVVTELTNFPFMMGGMPRPVRARAAKASMFVDCPRRPGMVTKGHWLSKSDPNFPIAKKLKDLVRDHRGETFALIKILNAEEEKLASTQKDVLRATYKKLEMVESVVLDGSLARLARYYGINLAPCND